MPNTPNRRKGDALLARIDERVISLDEAFRAHIVEDHARFELVFSHMKDRFDKVDKKLDVLWDQSNKNQGAFGASRIAVGFVWAVIVVGVNYYITKAGV